MAFIHLEAVAGRPVSKTADLMALETALAAAMLAAFIWAVRFLVPKALQEHDALAVVCAVLTAAIALLAWLLIGVGVGTGPRVE